MLVRVFAAGSHGHANSEQRGGTALLPNASGSEAEEVIEMLLTKAGYTKDVTWEARIDKMLHCSGETRPIRVVGYKTWGVQLRVKAQPNGTVDQLMTLMVPEGTGYSVKHIYEQLKANEKSISRQWRKECKPKQEVTPTVITPTVMQIPLAIKESVKELPVSHIPTPEPAPEPAAASTSARPAFKNLKGIYKDEDKLIYVLFAVLRLSRDSRIKTAKQFLTTWRVECKFHDDNINMLACGRAMKQLVRHDFVEEWKSDRLSGYRLTAHGKFIIGIPVDPADKPKTPVVPIAPPNYSKLLMESHDRMRELADAGSKLERNLRRKEELLIEIKKLDEEDEKLSKVLTQNKEAYDLLKRLLGFVSPLPLEGSKQQS